MADGPLREPDLRRSVAIDVYLNVAVAGILTGLVYGLMALGLIAWDLGDGLSCLCLDLLSFGRVFPEVRRRGTRLEPGQFFIGTGDFKDSSADPRRVCSDSRNGASTRRLSALS